MQRRDFLRRTATGIGATWLTSKLRAASLPSLVSDQPQLPRKYSAHDDVVLGNTGIRTSRLAMGTGTIGYGGASNQTRLGTSPFTRLLLDGYNDNGLRFYDTADAY